MLYVNKNGILVYVEFDMESEIVGFGDDGRFSMMLLW